MLVRPTEKVSRTSATSGKNESRALISMLNFFFNLQTMIYSKVWIKYTFVKSLKDIETDETSISQNAALLKNLFKESYFP